jgi:hypothetical protein
MSRVKSKLAIENIIAMNRSIMYSMFLDYYILLIGIFIYLQIYRHMFALDRKQHLSKYWFLYGIFFSIIIAFIYPEFGSKEGY